VLTMAELAAVNANILMVLFAFRDLGRKSTE